MHDLLYADIRNTILKELWLVPLVTCLYIKDGICVENAFARLIRCKIATEAARRLILKNINNKANEAPIAK